MPLVPFQEFQFCGPTYQQISSILDSERSFNLFPEPLYSKSRGSMGLVGRPGLQQLSNAINSPVRGLWGGNQRMFGVGGTHAYEINSSGAVVTDFGAMAGSAGTGPSYFAQNGGATGAFQLLVLDSSSSQIYNLSGGVATSVFNATALEYLDGYNFAIATGASLAFANNPNQINASNFGDGSTWNALNYVIRTGASDLTTQLAVLNGLLWIFGEQTIEVFFNAGLSGFPLARVNGGQLNLGLLAKHSVIKFQNCLMWLGRDGLGWPQVYMAQGLNPVRVSTAAIESIIQAYALGNYTNLFAYAYQEAGHTFYVLNIVNGSGTAVNAVVYDLSTGLWHERVWSTYWPSCAVSIQNFAAWPIVGDRLSGRLFYQNCYLASDAGVAIAYERTAPHLNAQLKVMRYSRFEMDGDIGDANPTLTYSNNGGRSFTSSPSFSMLQATDTGFTGQTFKRVFATQLGRSRDRVFKVGISSSTDVIRIANAYVWTE